MDFGAVQVLDFGLQSLRWFPDSKAHDSGFHKQKFPGFHNPIALHGTKHLNTDLVPRSPLAKD